MNPVEPTRMPARRVAWWLAAALCTSTAQAQTTQVPLASRGQLLYETHCVACHTTQMHWRDQRLVTSWATLKAQVLRWQGVAGLGWSDNDVVQVARFLNDTIYKLPQTSDRVSALGWR